jgi:dihydrofolate synthase/folylpolyglutamate synthase
MPPAQLGALATDIFGESKVTVEGNLPDALDRAIALAEEEGLGGGVIVTGSVITAGEVRLLLGVTDT